MEHLRVFECTAYVHIPKDEHGKLDSRTRKCTLLGYGSVRKRYRVFDHLTQKILYSRNEKFNERESVTAPVEDESSISIH